ncbi:MAG: aldehyde dehydrogenase family protein [Methanoregulaceae archaeon]|jgi:succinate-semialdehyde dehydrogenase/glutarate-semialdehyde dehydrogenase|nr:aldehyde dehydrogenase family protein [Methanoregulaceae archaeon]
MHMRINGAEVPSAGAGWKDVKNPATGETIDRVPDGTPEDVKNAVESAESAFPKWSGKTGRERGLLLFHAAAQVRDRHKELGRLLTIEQGKPLREAIDEVRGFCNVLEFYAGLSSQPAGEAIHLGSQGDCMVFHEPLGVCGAIIPWNMPVIIMGWKVAPALLAGNTIVMKPSSTAPLTALSISAILEEAGLPPGVLNIVTGSGGSAGEAIVTHPSVQKVSFTGSCATGCRVRELAGSRNKEVILELGGSDAMIVMNDADIRKAVDGAIRGRFYNAGQTCTAVKRLFVHRDSAESFISLLKVRVESLKVGNGLDPKVDMGPVNNRQQYDTLSEIMRSVKENREGTILTGGSPLKGDGYNNGYFFEPTLVRDVAEGSALLTGEIFGPVLPLMVIPDLDAAIREANRSPYGLGASIWTNDLATVKRVYHEVHAGIIWVNRHLTVPPEIPFGGTKESGIGRENGYRALQEYSRTKTLFLGW